jgi:DNA-binding SARP family transcriptional activator
MDFRILGPLEVYDDDCQIALGGSRQGALLAMLLLHRNEVVSSDRLIDELWSADPERDASKALQVAVSRLRRALRGDGRGNEVLLTRSPGYELRVEPGRLDVERFERLSAEGRAALEAGDAVKLVAEYPSMESWRAEAAELAAEARGR